MPDFISGVSQMYYIMVRGGSEVIITDYDKGEEGSKKRQIEHCIIVTHSQIVISENIEMV